MRKEINRVVLVGYAASIPEIRVAQDGKRIATLTIATHRKDATDWHRLIAFDEGIIDVMEREAEKGSYVYAEGRLQTRKWQDKNHQGRYTTEIVLEIFLVIKQEKHTFPKESLLREFLEGN